MKIVFVITSLAAGGAEKNLALLARRRAAAGDEVTVLLFVEPPGDPYFEMPAEVRVEVMERAGVPSAPPRVVRRLLWLRGRLKALRPDLVVSFLTKNNVLVLLATLDRKVPAIVCERNNPEAQRAHPAWRWGARLLASRAAVAVMQTEETRARLPARARARARVIPNPCATPEGVRAAPGADERIVAVGRLDWQKGFDLLLPAFAAVARERPKATLTIFGEGAERPALERQIRDLGLEGRASLPGVTKRPGAWVEQADVFVLSSRFEGFANVLAEAVAAGLPSVAFDCPYSPSEILDGGRAGLLVETGDRAALAAALGRLLADAPLRERLQTEARRAAARYQPERILALWDDAIADACLRLRRPPNPAGAARRTA